MDLTNDFAELKDLMTKFTKQDTSNKYPLDQINQSEQYFNDLLQGIKKQKAQLTLYPRNAYQRAFIYFLAGKFNYHWSTTFNHKQHHHNFRIIEHPDKFEVVRSKQPHVEIILFRGSGDNHRNEETCSDTDPRFGTCGTKEVKYYDKQLYPAQQLVLKQYPEYLHKNYVAGNHR